MDDVHLTLSKRTSSYIHVEWYLVTMTPGVS
jgi:hypothetical protein